MVWALKEGKQAAAEVDRFLMGDTRLPWQGGIAVRSWLPPPITEGVDAHKCNNEKCNGNGDAHSEDDVKTEVGEGDEKPWLNGTAVAAEAVEA